MIAYGVLLELSTTDLDDGLVRTGNAVLFKPLLRHL